MVHSYPSPTPWNPWSRSRTGPMDWTDPQNPVPDCSRGLAYLSLMQVRRKWTQKKPPKGLGSVVGLVLGLGELDFCLVEGSEVAQGLRFEPEPLGDFGPLHKAEIELTQA